MSSYQERFAEACNTADFAPNPRTIGGYDVWGVDDIAKGGRVQIDGPYFTPAEAEIAADLLKPLFPFARAFVAVHCWAWNPDPRREKAIRDDAMASRMMLAEQLGVDIPKQGAHGAQG
ncbi:hypothetical protein NLO98_16880 [Pseudomonas syringae]|nr:hypothetical protein [Pseudomonas syringae]